MQTCWFISDDLTPCTEPAVITTRRYPRCARHRSTVLPRVLRNLTEYRRDRALSRGLLEVARACDAWYWDDLEYGVLREDEAP